MKYYKIIIKVLQIQRKYIILKQMKMKLYFYKPNSFAEKQTRKQKWIIINLKRKKNTYSSSSYYTEEDCKLQRFLQRSLWSSKVKDFLVNEH